MAISNKLANLVWPKWHPTLERNPAWLRFLGMSAKDCHEASLKSSWFWDSEVECKPLGPRHSRSKEGKELYDLSFMNPLLISMSGATFDWNGMGVSLFGGPAINHWRVIPAIPKNGKQKISKHLVILRRVRVKKAWDPGEHQGQMYVYIQRKMKRPNRQIGKSCGKDLCGYKWVLQNSDIKITIINNLANHKRTYACKYTSIIT